ncbi:uncharacterized protein BYT42DRAFT_309243 [Radiomyces spectabilis]|uniref:uncharacterized protein n=1 Tax=Radiomyces spectabilis TaxID=64574 RepID=UPI00221F6F8C|nr:uncharacterized protein BYT42DRAFT_309243 [Radiomyces spectabilis]KAI8381551.1 hypothetical protein BYT42DRAFT_309243 [Radiomyces spectabilis]
MANESMRLPASRAITMLMTGDTMTPFNRTLLSIRNMVEKLPDDYLDGSPMKTESITRTLVSDEKALSEEKPDAIISVINGASFSRAIAYGIAKSEVQAINHNLVTRTWDALDDWQREHQIPTAPNLAFAFFVGYKQSCRFLSRPATPIMPE